VKRRHPSSTGSADLLSRRPCNSRGRRPSVLRQHPRKSPPMAGFGCRAQWRPGSESNRRTRLCRPLHDHSATWPLRTERVAAARLKTAKPRWSEVLETGAGNETRTRDPDLGKVVLYQLSYSRVRVEKDNRMRPNVKTSGVFPHVASDRGNDEAPAQGRGFDEKSWSGKRDSNSRPRPWQGRALPTELFPHRSRAF
jgi:hypothetical protein